MVGIGTNWTKTQIATCQLHQHGHANDRGANCALDGGLIHWTNATPYGEQQAATDDLERAMKIEPNEPNTVLLMGQVYKAMGKLAQAVQMMTIARDLDPKNAQKINRMIEAFKAESSKASSTSVFGGTGGYRGGAAGTAVGTGGTTRGGPAAGNQNPNPVQNRGGMLAGAGGYAGGPGYGYGYAAASGSASQSFEANGSADISMDSS